jgi:hypothetical protein
MDQSVIDFFKTNAALEHNKDMLVPPAGITNDTEMFFKWIRHESKCKSLRLDVNADVSEIKEEIKNKVELAIAHRGHPGWRALTLFGYSSVMTNSSEYYKEKGMITEYDTPDWTDVSKFFPKTVAWLKTHNPLTDFVRIRLMILDPGGSSSPHKDYPYGQMLCGPLNIAGAADEIILEWHGQQRWIKAPGDEATFSAIKALANSHGGHATRFRQGTAVDPSYQRFTLLSEQAHSQALEAVQERLRSAFDPAGVFATKRLP